MQDLEYQRDFFWWLCHFKTLLTLTLGRPLASIVMPEQKKSQYELVRAQNIEERELDFLRVFGYPIDLNSYKY